MPKEVIDYYCKTRMTIVTEDEAVEPDEYTIPWDIDRLIKHEHDAHRLQRDILNLKNEAKNSTIRLAIIDHFLPMLEAKLQSITIKKPTTVVYSHTHYIYSSYRILPSGEYQTLNPPQRQLFEVEVGCFTARIRDGDQTMDPSDFVMEYRQYRRKFKPEVGEGFHEQKAFRTFTEENKARMRQYLNRLKKKYNPDMVLEYETGV